MRFHHAWCCGLLLIVTPLVASEPRSRAVLDVSSDAYLQGSRVGSVRTTVHEVEQDGTKIFRTTTRLKLALRRGEATAMIQMETGSEETADGKVTSVSMTQFNGGALGKLHLKGTVHDDELEIKVEGNTPMEKRIPWNNQVIGLYRQERLFQDRKVKPGDNFSFSSFEPTIASVITNRVAVKDYEETEVLGHKKRLLRVEIVPDKIVTPDGGVQLPGLTTWLDDTFQSIRSEVELPPIGTMVLYRAPKGMAAPDRPVGDLPSVDILKTSLIPLNQAIPQSIQARSAVYRVTLKGNGDPLAAFAQDERQSSEIIKGGTFKLSVRALPAAKAGENAPQPGKEFLGSCYWLNSNDARVQQLAHEAVGNETDSWKKAERIERWVYRNLTNTLSVPFVPAGVVAKTLRGDCRQHSMLAAAMCRAEGIPARTAVGLVYGHDDMRKPVMAFHMWTEVWRDGQWFPLDPTLGHVGATHLKIASHSWYNEQSLRPMLAVLPVLGKLSIEIVSVDGAD
jgi:hypothetical protein